MAVVDDPLDQVPTVGPGRQRGLELADLVPADDFHPGEFAGDFVAVEGERADLVVLQTLNELAERNGGVGSAGLVQQHDQHDGQRNEEEPAEEPPTEGHAARAGRGSAVLLVATGAAPVAAVAGRLIGRAVWTLFGHATAPFTRLSGG